MKRITAGPSVSEDTSLPAPLGEAVVIAADQQAPIPPGEQEATADEQEAPLMGPLHVLPPELLLRVLRFLSPYDLLELMKVNSFWRAFLRDLILWNSYLLPEYRLPNATAAEIQRRFFNEPLARRPQYIAHDFPDRSYIFYSIINRRWDDLLSRLDREKALDNNEFMRWNAAYNNLQEWFNRRPIEREMHQSQLTNVADPIVQAFVIAARLGDSRVPTFRLVDQAPYQTIYEAAVRLTENQRNNLNDVAVRAFMVTGYLTFEQALSLTPQMSAILANIVVQRLIVSGRLNIDKILNLTEIRDEDGNAAGLTVVQISILNDPAVQLLRVTGHLTNDQAIHLTLENFSLLRNVMVQIFILNGRLNIQDVLSLTVSNDRDYMFSVGIQTLILRDKISALDALHLTPQQINRLQQSIVQVGLMTGQLTIEEALASIQTPNFNYNLSMCLLGNGLLSFKEAIRVQSERYINGESTNYLSTTEQVLMFLMASGRLSIQQALTLDMLVLNSQVSIDSVKQILRASGHSEEYIAELDKDRKSFTNELILKKIYEISARLLEMGSPLKVSPTSWGEMGREVMALVVADKLSVQEAIDLMGQDLSVLASYDLMVLLIVSDKLTFKEALALSKEDIAKLVHSAVLLFIASGELSIQQGISLTEIQRGYLFDRKVLALIASGLLSVNEAINLRSDEFSNIRLQTLQEFVFTGVVSFNEALHSTSADRSQRYINKHHANLSALTAPAPQPPATITSAP